MFKKLFNKKKEKKEEKELLFDNGPEILDTNYESEISYESEIENTDLIIDPELLSLNSNSSMIPNYDNDKVSVLSDSTYDSSVDYEDDDNDEMYIHTFELLLSCYDY
jgi:hypothetical protein